MADTKISALTASTTPLAGTEVLPIVQSGTTKQVSVANLTAGRAIAATNITASGEITSTTNDARLSLYRATGINYFDWASGQTLAFGTQTSQSGAGRVNKVNFTDAGNVEIANGNLVISTSGKGIDFSATAGTGTSELFADYEEGDWTPDLRFGGSATGITYTSRVGKYIKIGKSVYVTFDINLSSKGSATGGGAIYGLPFTARTEIGASIAVGIQINMLAVLTFQNRVENDGTIISLGQPSGVTTQAVTDTSFNNNTRIAGSGFYFVP